MRDYVSRLIYFHSLGLVEDVRVSTITPSEFETYMCTFLQDPLLANAMVCGQGDMTHCRHRCLSFLYGLVDNR